MSKFFNLALLILPCVIGCAIQTIPQTTNKTNDLVIAQDNKSSEDNFNILTEVTVIPTKKPWQSPVPTPSIPNDPLSGSASASFNYATFGTNSFNIFNGSVDGQGLSLSIDRIKVTTQVL